MDFEMTLAGSFDPTYDTVVEHSAIGEARDWMGISMKKEYELSGRSCAAAVAITSSKSRVGLHRLRNHRGSQSVRPTTGEIRTAVDGLLGWHVGIFGNIFPR